MIPIIKQLIILPGHKRSRRLIATNPEVTLHNKVLKKDQVGLNPAGLHPLHEARLALKADDDCIA